jgi:hypothetical protein
VIAGAWVAGYTALNFELYRIALTVERPSAPAQSFEAWSASQKKIAEDAAKNAEDTCRKDNQPLFSTSLDEALIEAEIKQKVASGISEVDARREGDAKLSAKKSKNEDALAKLCFRPANMIDPATYNQDQRRKNELIDELYRRVLDRIQLTILGLVIIVSTPMAIGFLKRIYTWVRAGR